VSMKNWTPEARAAAAERARTRKPWLHSTGPKTESGKSRSKMNAYRHGDYGADVREFRRVLRLQAHYPQYVRLQIAIMKERAKIKKIRERTEFELGNGACYILSHLEKTRSGA